MAYPYDKIVLMQTSRFESHLAKFSIFKVSHMIN